MARLICVDALGIGRCNPDVFGNKAYADGWNAAISMIENAPTVDAEPVRHGNWIRNGVFCAKCSECGKNSVDIGKYCSNCGAKLEEESENG